MLKVKVLTVGRSKESWLAEAIAEYEKRLQGKLQFEWLIAKDDPQLLQWCKQEPFLIALDLKGDLVSSEQLSRKLTSLFAVKGSRLAFCIGGPEGLPGELQAQWRWCLSPLTFTHQIVRLILIEQLYRALEIDKGSQYHK